MPRAAAVVWSLASERGQRRTGQMPLRMPPPPCPLRHNVNLLRLTRSVSRADDGCSAAHSGDPGPDGSDGSRSRQAAWGTKSASASGNGPLVSCHFHDAYRTVRRRLPGCGPSHATSRSMGRAVCSVQRGGGVGPHAQPAQRRRPNPAPHAATRAYSVCVCASVRSRRRDRCAPLPLPVQPRKINHSNFSETRRQKRV